MGGGGSVPSQAAGENGLVVRTQQPGDKVVPRLGIFVVEHAVARGATRSSMGGSLSSMVGYLISGGEHKVVMVGLDNAGKSTILYRMHLGDVIATHPTVGSNVEEVVHRNVRFRVWDLGGQDKLRKVWSTYYSGAHAVVLVVDSMDPDRLPLVYEELTAIAGSEELRTAALLVLANKQDVNGAMSAVEISQQLKLHASKLASWQIQPCSALTGAGLAEGMDWLAHVLRTRALGRWGSSWGA